MKTVKVATKLTLTIKRPNGKIEKVVAPNLKYITETQFKQIQRDTKAANGSEVISYEIDYENKKVMTSLSEMEYASQDHTVENMSRMGE